MLAYVKSDFLNLDRSLKRPTAQLGELCTGEIHRLCYGWIQYVCRYILYCIYTKAHDTQRVVIMYDLSRAFIVLQTNRNSDRDRREGVVEEDQISNKRVYGTHMNFLCKPTRLLIISFHLAYTNDLSQRT